MGLACTHPVPGARISQHFYQNPQEYARWGLPGHNGVDLAAPAGTPIQAIAAGIVSWIGYDDNYGNYIRVWHEHLSIYSFYAHLANIDLPEAQRVGTLVTVGQMIGYVGSTGNATGAHLHLEIRLAGADGEYNECTPMPRGRVDPETWSAIHGLKL